MIRLKVCLVRVLLLLLVSYSSSLQAQYQIVEIGNVQVAKVLSAVVKDPTGSPLPGVKVEEMSPEWKQTIRSTQTDDSGRFTLAPIRGRKLYYLQLSRYGLDPLRVRVALNARKGKDLELEMVVAT